MIKQTAQFLALFVAASGAQPAAADEALPVAVLDDDTFLESYSPEVSVSGAVIVGVSSSKVSSGSTTKSLAVISLPKRDERKICLTLLSRDGAYYSRSEFSLILPENSGGLPVPLPYDKTTRRDILDNYGDMEIAMLARAGDCGQTDGPYYIVDTLATEPPAAVRIYINSFGATDVYYKIADKSEACSFIETGQRTSFDYWCELPWAEVDTSQPVHILRERFGRDLPEVELTLLTAPH